MEPLAAMGVAPNSRAGCRAHQDVAPDGEAARAIPGLQAGMILLEVDGEEPTSYEAVLETLNDMARRPIRLRFALSPYNLPPEFANALNATRFVSRLHRAVDHHSLPGLSASGLSVLPEQRTSSLRLSAATRPVREHSKHSRGTSAVRRKQPESQLGKQCNEHFVKLRAANSDTRALEGAVELLRGSQPV